MKQAARILVIDDEKAILDLIEMILKRERFQVATASNGKTALCVFDSFNPDLVILDIMLPDTNGHEICKEITKRRSTPIIMLTAKDDIVDKVLGLELGADDYITKLTRELTFHKKIQKKYSIVSTEPKMPVLFWNWFRSSHC